ncbi:MAG: hypothetical protein RJA61_568 [Candidatus Parcubacteria bacterium]|jgi:preprotein translocase subunit SecA
MFLSRFFGSHNKRILGSLKPLVEKINALEITISVLSDEELRLKTTFFKEEVKKGKTLDEVLPEAFAVVREASKRTLGQRHFDVQLMGGALMHRGGIAEMKTGEGKTLVATLPAYLNALEEKGVHVVTVNDYLSRRDAVWMGQIFSFLGLSVGVLNHAESYLYDPEHKDLDRERDEIGSYKVIHEFLRPATRRDVYDADITYGTNTEFGFDYLRDNLEYEYVKIRQTHHHFAIVDEIDSILIDEARTPLIISAPTTDSENLYKVFSGIAEKMNADEHYTVDEKHKTISLTDSGIGLAEKLLGVENIYTEKGIKYVHHLETAIRAKANYKRDKDYVVKNDEIVIVDSFTGRLQPGRRWSEGLHQAIEAKESVSIQKESRTFASITYQNYFRMYKKLAGMTGTAATSSEEFFKVYGLETFEVPTNKPIARKDHNDLIFQTEKGKFKALARQVKTLQKKGQPVLIGTVSIENNEMLSDFLKREGVQHEVLNAKNHEREGEIIAQAGKKGSVTIATNMAGRGVDIKLGGNPTTLELSDEIRNLGGLYVIGTERHEARRIDNQLRGRSGRQGDPGETQFYVCLEDSLMRIFAKDMIKNMMGRLGIAEDEPIQNRIITRSLESAQKKIEGFHFDSRKHVLEFDNVLNYQRKLIYDRRRSILGGNFKEIYDHLAVISEGDEALKQILETKKTQLGEESFAVSYKQILLQTIDMFWVEHLEAMDYIRGSVNLRAYGQRDPLVEYKREGLKLFKDMEEAISHEIKKIIPNVGGIAPRENIKLQEISATAGVITKENQERKTGIYDGVGRNDECPCGSGKKFKKCHGK